MAKKNTQVEILREQVRKQHQAANAKVARNRKQGVELAGSQFDIRRDIARVRRYNMQQLNAYLNELMGFNSRKTQFSASSGGKPVTRESWRYHLQLQSRVNNIGEAHENAVADIYIPYSGMYIKERMAMLHPLERFDRDTPRPYTKVDRKLKNIEGQKALDMLNAQLERKLNKDATIAKSVRQTKRNFKKILKEMGASDLASRVDRLTINQADILFNYTSLADIIANGYKDWKEFRAGGKEDSMAAVVNEGRVDVIEILDWAKTLPKK